MRRSRSVRPDRRAVRIILLVVVLTLCMPVCSCTLPNAPESGAPAAQASDDPDAAFRIHSEDAQAAGLAKTATVIGYLLGPRHDDMDAIVEAVNERLLRDMNTRLELHFINWGDITTRYPLILSAGEGVDWIYTSNWNRYVDEAVKGSFLELSRQTLERWMPNHMAATPAAAWKDALLDGRIFMVPTATPDTKYPVMLLREDLRVLYNVPEITRFTDLEPYLAAILENEPDMVPLALDNGYDVSTCRQSIMGEDGFMPGTVCDGITYNIEDPAYQAVSYVDEPARSSFRKTALIMKDWYDKGYVNKNPFANNIRSKEAFQDGKTAVGLGNLYDVDANILLAENAGYKVKVVPMLTKSGRYSRDCYTNNGVAIASSSRQPERAMLVLDRLMEHPAYNDLVTFGIEGVHYTVTDNNRIRLADAASGHAPVYTHTGFWFTNKNQWRPLADWSEQYTALRANADDILFDMPLSAFAFSQAEVKDELDQVSTAFRRYGDPLSVGAVQDVDETLRVLESVMHSSGVDLVKMAVQSQIDAYLADRAGTGKSD